MIKYTLDKTLITIVAIVLWVGCGAGLRDGTYDRAYRDINDRGSLCDLPLTSGEDLGPTAEYGDDAQSSTGDISPEMLEEQSRQDRETRIIEVAQKGYIGSVAVQHGMVTRLIFSSEIVSARADESELFGLSVNRIIKDQSSPIRQIVINPSARAKSTILYVETSDYEVILDIVHANDSLPAHRYISFVSREDESRFRDRVNHAIEQKLQPRMVELQELDSRYRQLIRDHEALLKERVQTRLAHALWEDFIGHGRTEAWCRFEHKTVNADMILRAGWVRWIGDRVFIALSIHGRRDLRIDQITLKTADAVPRAMGYAFREEGQYLLRRGAEGHLAVAGLDDARALAGKQVALRVEGPDLQQAVVVPIVLPSPECETGR